MFQALTVYYTYKEILFNFIHKKLVDEMQKFCVYNSYSANHNIPIWLFEILREYDENLKAKFLFYTLGRI